MEKLKQMLTEHEGSRNKIYSDTNGIPHIGIGRNLQQGISEDEINYLLENDIVRCMKECANAFPWYSQLDEVRQDVLVMLCFSMGLTRLRGFKNMLSALEQGDFEVSAAELVDSRWYVQVGPLRGETLKEMLATGEYPNGNH